MAWIGLDIGGANIKVATCGGRCTHAPFPLWRQLDRLAATLAELLDRHAAEQADDVSIAAVMTGELADCFDSREEGVRAIVHALQQAAGRRRVALFGLDADWHAMPEALARPSNFGAANWLALATWTARQHPNAELLIDIGTTTTDIVPLHAGRPRSRALVDTDRLAARELVYTGVVRTPLFALGEEATYRGKRVPITPEFFATALDVYLLLGDLEEMQWDEQTADGRPSTIGASIGRLARSILAAGGTEFDASDARRLARELAESQHRKLATDLVQALSNHDAHPAEVVISGTGEFLARRLVQQTFETHCIITSLADTLTSDQSRCAPAYAVARLAHEDLGQ